MLENKCNLKMHVRSLGYPLPLQIGNPKTPFFRRLRNLTATSTAYIFGIKIDIHNRTSAWKLPLPISSQNVTNFGPQMAWNWTCIFIHTGARKWWERYKWRRGVYIQLFIYIKPVKICEDIW